MGTTSVMGQTSNSFSPEGKSGRQAEQKPAVGLPTQLSSNKLFS